jgi:hypothetical protein
MKRKFSDEENKTAKRGRPSGDQGNELVTEIMSLLDLWIPPSVVRRMVEFAVRESHLPDAAVLPLRSTDDPVPRFELLEWFDKRNNSSLASTYSKSGRLTTKVVLEIHKCIGGPGPLQGGRCTC